MSRFVYNEYFINRYLDDVLKVYNYIDGIIMTDEKGIIQYYNSFRPDLNTIDPVSVQGQHILDVYPGLDENSSTIMRVLKTGEHIYDEYQTVTNFKGQKRYLIETAIPIKSQDRVVGAVNVSRYVIQNRNMGDLVMAAQDQKGPRVIPFEAGGINSVDGIVSRSLVMEEVKSKILKVAKTSSNVLIHGETGTGKDLVAQAIHYHSLHSDKPFVYQNCSAIPGNLLESILFGTEKGAYTGAEDKKGLFQIAEGGTLFLDEINSMDIQLQPKILSATEKKQIRRVGGTEQIHTDVRLVSAMNQTPQDVLQEERLRKDLFYRLGAILIYVPPLRERKEDILLLSEHFIEVFNNRFHKRITGISPAVEAIFMSYGWYGNVRELKNIIEGAVVLSSGNVITEAELPDYILMGREALIQDMRAEAYQDTKAGPTEGTADKNHSPGYLKSRMDEYEKQIILSELKKESCLSRVAETLGISRQALNYKMKKMELREPLS